MKLRARLPFVLAALALSPVALWAQEHGEESQGGIFDINAGLSFWTIVIFLSLLFVLWKFAWGPILAAVDAREEAIQKALDEAKERQEEAERLLAEHREQLADARRQAQEIVAEGRSAGDTVRKEIEEKAREEGQSLISRARQEIGREKDAALDSLRRESVELALAAAARLIAEKVDSEKDHELVMDYLDKLSGPGSGAEA
ncbi:MAG: F0F1 ATP synthase subunit B [Gemmatimonadetes bacterium]|nr:F0F1 ATP synthase subunit B [Gemmatimonadota bacterium]